jgi:hypothetical protein
MAAAGAGVTGAALKVKNTGPKGSPYQYGGNQAAADAYRLQNQAGMTAGQGEYDRGVGLQNQALGQYAGIGGQGAALAQNPYQFAGAQDSGRRYIEQMDPRAVAQANAQAALAQSARQNLGAAAMGGALGIRNATQANAMAGLGIGAQTAALALQGEQQKAQMMQQATMQGTMLNQQIQDRAIQQTGMGLQAQGQAADALAGIGGGAMSAGMNREQMYYGGQQDLESQALQAQIARDQARMQNQQQKRQIIGGLGGALIGGGTSMMASGMGGK